MRARTGLPQRRCRYRQRNLPVRQTTKDRIGPHDDFFLVGGDSLAATQLVLSVDLPLLTIDERIPRHNGGDSGSGKKKSRQKLRLSDSEVFDLFILDKSTGLRLMRPGDRVGSVVVNSHGYRSPEIPLQRPAETIRFAFLGDLLTFGSWSGGNETTWPFHVLETLRRAHEGLSCDYVNAAMPGNGVRHVKIQLRESISKFQPDVVALVPGAVGSRADWARKKIGYSGVHYVVSRLGRRSQLRLYYEPYMSIPAFLDVKDEFNRVFRKSLR